MHEVHEYTQNIVISIRKFLFLLGLIIVPKYEYLI